MNISHLSLHQLRILAAVAEAGGISRAAATLHLTQPTLSIQLKQLADVVGQPLIEFTGRRLHLTDAGHEVLSTARAIDDQLVNLRSRLAARRGLHEGRLRVAAVSTAEYFLPRVLGEFKARHPQVQATRVRAEEVLRDLFGLYADDATPLPEDFAARPDRERACADYIAGMTDRFAIREHQRLTGKTLF